MSALGVRPGTLVSKGSGPRPSADQVSPSLDIDGKQWDPIGPGSARQHEGADLANARTLWVWTSMPVKIPRGLDADLRARG